jgi:WD40 repeat protein
MKWMRARFTRRDAVYIGFSVMLVLLLACVLPLTKQLQQRDQQPYLLHWRGYHGVGPDGIHVGFRSGSNHVILLDIEGRLLEWEIDVEKPIKTIILETPPEKTWECRILDVSPDGHWGVTNNYGGRQYFFVWDLWTGQLVGKVRPSLGEFQTPAIFSPDGDWLAATGVLDEPEEAQLHRRLSKRRQWGLIQVWDWRSGRTIWQGKVRSPIENISWGRDGVLAAVSIHERGGEVTIWQPGRKKRLMQQDLSMQATCVALSPDGKWVVVAEPERGAWVLDAHTGKQREILKGPISAENNSPKGIARVVKIKISGDGRWVAGSTSSGVMVWDLRTGTYKGIYRTEKWHGSYSYVPSEEDFALSTDGKWLVLGTLAGWENAVFRLAED